MKDFLNTDKDSLAEKRRRKRCDHQNATQKLNVRQKYLIMISLKSSCGVFFRLRLITHFYGRGHRRLLRFNLCQDFQFGWEKSTCLPKHNNYCSFLFVFRLYHSFTLRVENLKFPRLKKAPISKTTFKALFLETMPSTTAMMKTVWVISLTGRHFGTMMMMMTICQVLLPSLNCLTTRVICSMKAAAAH